MSDHTRKQPIFLGTTGDPESVNEPTWPYPGQVGLKVTMVQPHRTAAGVEEGRRKTYQLVQGDSSMSTAPFPGAAMWWSDKSQHKVTTSPTATHRNNIAGLCQGTPGKGNYFFVQTQGPATGKITDSAAGSVVAGDTAIPSATAGKLDRVAIGTAPTHRPFGLYTAVANGNAEAVVDLDVPDVP